MFACLPWLTSSSLEMMCKRTSGNSSLSICRNMGSKWSIVLIRCYVSLRSDGGNKVSAETYSCLPRIGASPLI